MAVTDALADTSISGEPVDEAATLRTPVLPGFSLPIAEIFADLGV